MKGTAINCSITSVQEVIFSKEKRKYYPYISTEQETGLKLYSPSPIHGRSIVVDYDKETKRYIITKGNGLTYFPFGFVSTQELEGHAWGYLSKKDAERDFLSGEYINSLGILTNQMEAVYSLEKQTIKSLDQKYELEPYILQYNVECPYRIADLPYISNNLKNKFIKTWATKTKSNYTDYHCIAADIMLSNTHIMHSNGVLHNAIHNQNYTLSLELLDFELARTPNSLYENSIDEEKYEILQKREIIQSLEIVNYIAFHFKENVNSKVLKLIMEKYGYGSLLK